MLIAAEQNVSQCGGWMSVAAGIEYCTLWVSTTTRVALFLPGNITVVTGFSVLPKRFTWEHRYSNVGCKPNLLQSMLGSRSEIGR